VQYSWELEQKSYLLEQTMAQLRHEVEQRTQAEQALLLANAEILALNQSLQADKLTLEERVRDRTKELETALQQLQQTQIQLIQTEKMSSLGQMVAGIAHEINNPINFIHGNTVHLNEYVKDLCKLLQMYQATFTPTRSITAYEEDVDIEFILEDIPQLLDSINLGTKRVKEIVLAMRNYSRLDEAEVKEVDIHEGIESTLLILHHRIKQGINVIKDYATLPRIACNPAQLNQVFTNIIVNALDAMEEQPNARKQLFISTCAIAPDAIQISFRDTGSGIPPDIQAKIFDPFFTTKSVGKGTGLGLGICYQIVRRHGGEITVNSTPQQGTEFVITLPIQLPTHEREQGAIDRTS
jgi:signal transduction histidine kinase